MPRVVPDQKSKFENEEFFRKLSRECEVSGPAAPAGRGGDRPGGGKVWGSCQTRASPTSWAAAAAGPDSIRAPPPGRGAAGGLRRAPPQRRPGPGLPRPLICTRACASDLTRDFWPLCRPQIKYTGFRDRPHEERQARFQNACRDGRSEIAFVATGTNLSLQFFPASWQGEQRQTPSREYVDLEREAGKVYLKAPMILNGVCVIWKGWIDLQRLDGMGCLEFDEERAQQEDALAQQAFEEARRRTREFEDRDRSHREEMERVRALECWSWKGPTIENT
uniref:Core-binding factor subunit beta n=1 Tax=Sarcophilus harrisii TaxID=9305 RepID=A0A7N4P3X7_SARHA